MFGDADLFLLIFLHIDKTNTKTTTKQNKQKPQKQKHNRDEIRAIVNTIHDLSSKWQDQLKLNALQQEKDCQRISSLEKQLADCHQKLEGFTAAQPDETEPHFEDDFVDVGKRESFQLL